MNGSEVIIVRVYLHEGEGRLSALLAYLHDDSRVRGVTVFRGITGFGKSGQYHSSALIDISLDLPVVIEFFDTPGRIEPILEYLNAVVEPGHVIYWSAKMNE